MFMCLMILTKAETVLPYHKAGLGHQEVLSYCAAVT